MVVFYSNCSPDQKTFLNASRGNRVSIDVPDLTGSGDLVGRDEFVAGRDNGDAPGNEDRNGGNSRGSQCSDILCAKNLTFSEKGLSVPDVFSGLNDIFTRSGRL